MKRERRTFLKDHARYVAAGLVENFEVAASGQFDHLDLTPEETEVIIEEMEAIGRRIWSAPTKENDEPCPACGNEERGQGGYLSCECPAPRASGAAAIRNMGGGDKPQSRDNLSAQPHGDYHDSAFHPAKRTAEEPAANGDRGAEGAGQARRTGGHSGPLLGERARADDQSGDSGFGNSLTTAGRDALEKERGDG